MKFISFLFLSYFQIVLCKDFFVWLQSNAVTDGMSGKDYLKNHILTMETFVPSFRLIRKYNSLVMYGFLVYSATIDEIEDWEQFLQLAENEIKVVEEIQSTFRVAQAPKKLSPVEFVPYVPPPMEAITVSSDGNGLCTLTYDFLHRTMTNGSTLHEMVTPSFLFSSIHKHSGCLCARHRNPINTRLTSRSCDTWL
jgi:hypothetical protein